MLIREGADIHAGEGRWRDRGMMIEDGGWMIKYGGRQAIHIAAESGFPGIVNALIQAGANVNARTLDGTTPLHFAASQFDRPDSQSRPVETARMLITFGAEVNATSNSGTTPLHNAAEKDLPGMVQLLVENEASVNVTNKAGRTPLHKAAFSVLGLSQNARILIEAGADVNAPDANDETPLHAAAAACSSLDVVDILIDAGSDVCAIGWGEGTPRHRAEYGAPWAPGGCLYYGKVREVVLSRLPTCRN